MDEDSADGGDDEVKGGEEGRSLLGVTGGEEGYRSDLTSSSKPSFPPDLMFLLTSLLSPLFSPFLSDIPFPSALSEFVTLRGSRHLDCWSISLPTSSPPTSSVHPSSLSHSSSGGHDGFKGGGGGDGGLLAWD